MKHVSDQEIIKKIDTENPWWTTGKVLKHYNSWIPRPYMDLLFPLIESPVKRAVILMGPRRVGKTVLIHHCIQELLKNKVAPNRICFLSIDQPLYNGLDLERLVDLYADSRKISLEKQHCYVFFDEIQYFKKWEIHLKLLVDRYPNIRFLASGSAAAALKLKSSESGAGRFTDFLLPPLTFQEYLHVLRKDHLISVEERNGSILYNVKNQTLLNKEFINYINIGGYPEVIFSPTIQKDPIRFIKSDIVDKVLMRDLPSLYGIQDVQELNYLFTTLAFNTANEISLEGLSQLSGVSKGTIKRYLDYLEAAFLVKSVHRIDKNGKKFKRANFLKIYLTNPSIRSALFSPTNQENDDFGALVETAVFSQHFHSDIPLFYARWRAGTDEGEVDLVRLDASLKPSGVTEVKWSDRFVDKPKDLKGLVKFCQSQNINYAIVTTKSKSAVLTYKNIRLMFIPASVYTFLLGYSILSGKREQLKINETSQ